MSRKSRTDTKQKIMQVATVHFLERGFTGTLLPDIARELKISLGNLTYHFPTKEHLFAEFIRHLCAYQWLVLTDEVKEGLSSLLAYCLEIATIVSACSESEAAKDYYKAAYIHPLSLSVIRENDTRKARLVFGEYCPDWSERDFAAAENIVSGIEYASIMEENTEGITLDGRIRSSLDAVMKIYNVPDELRGTKIGKVLDMDYRAIGHTLLDGFGEYVRQATESVPAAESINT